MSNQEWTQEDRTFEHPDYFKIIGRLGKGGFGSVVKCINTKESKKEYALKKIPNYAGDHENYARKIVREYEVLAMLQGSLGVCGLHKMYLSKDKKDAYLLMPCYAYDLENILKQFATENRLLPEPQLKFIAYQILLGVSSLHKKKLMHRDLTLANIFANVREEDGYLDVALGDFGLARAQQVAENTDITMDVVTVEYRPPELLLQYSKYDSRCDCWSAGCIIAEMFLRHRLFRPEPRDIRRALELVITKLGKPDMDFIKEYASEATCEFVQNIIEEADEINEGAAEDPPNWCEVQSNGTHFASLPVPIQLAMAGASADAIDVILGLLQFDFRKRFTAAAALKMPWFTNDPEYATYPGVSDKEKKEDSDQEVFDKPASASATASSGGSGNSPTSPGPDELNSSAVTRQNDGSIVEAVQLLNDLQSYKRDELTKHMESRSEEVPSLVRITYEG